MKNIDSAPLRSTAGSTPPEDSGKPRENLRKTSWKPREDLVHLAPRRLAKKSQNSEQI